jgi:hypothetical protein
MLLKDPYSVYTCIFQTFLDKYRHCMWAHQRRTHLQLDILFLQI